MTSLVTCINKHKNTFKEVKNINKDKNFVSSLYREIINVYQNYTGDYNYKFLPTKEEPFSPLSQTIININYTQDHTVTSASIGINEEASILYDGTSGDITILFGQTVGSTIDATFNVPWASYSTSLYTQLNDDGGSPYVGTLTTITDKLFDISYTSYEVNINIYENSTVNNQISRTITFNPYEIIFNDAAKNASEVESYIKLNQNPFHAVGLEPAISYNFTDTPNTIFFANNTSYNSLYGYSLSYVNELTGLSPDSMVTQIVVAGIVPNYFDNTVTQSLNEMLVDFTTTTPLPNNSKILEEIIRITFPVFYNTYNTPQINYSFNNSNCRFSIQTIHDEETECI